MSILPGTATSQSIALGGTSVQSTALVEGQFYRLTASGNCWVKFGTNPTSVAAAADNHYLSATGASAVLDVQMIGLGASPKISVIQDGAATGYLVISLAAAD